jgi:DNA-binding NarL/FixJ family response regulator
MTVNGATDSGVTTRCLIADDRAMVREGFARCRAQPGQLVVGQAADSADAMSQAQHGPDVVLMDVGCRSWTGCKQPARSSAPPAWPERPRVLMLTTFDLDDYVMKRCRRCQRLPAQRRRRRTGHAVRVVAIATRCSPVGDPAADRRLRPPATPGPAVSGHARALTHRESEVLRLIAAACPTPRSATPWSSPSRPPDTSAASGRSSTSATAPRPSCSPRSRPRHAGRNRPSVNRPGHRPQQ